MDRLCCHQLSIWGKIDVLKSPPESHPIMCTDLKHFITKGFAHFVTQAVKAVSAVRQVVVTVTGIRKEYATCRIVFCHEVSAVNGDGKLQQNRTQCSCCLHSCAVVHSTTDALSCLNFTYILVNKQTHFACRLFAVVTTKCHLLLHHHHPPDDRK